MCIRATGPGLSKHSCVTQLVADVKANCKPPVIYFIFFTKKKYIQKMRLAGQAFKYCQELHKSVGCKSDTKLAILLMHYINS